MSSMKTLVPLLFGLSFLATLSVDEFMIVGTKRVILDKDGKRKEFLSKGPHGGPHVTLELSTPFGTQKTNWRTVVATGFDGYATIPVDRAKKLGLELWEIPGKVRVEGLHHAGDCRRARMRCQIGKLKIDYRVPVAVWTR